MQLAGGQTKVKEHELIDARTKLSGLQQEEHLKTRFCKSQSSQDAERRRRSACNILWSARGLIEKAGKINGKSKSVF